MKNARRKFEVPMPAAMPCKTQRGKYRESCRVENNCMTKYACIVEADDSKRKRMEGSLHKYHEDHIAGKGLNSLSHYNFVHIFTHLLQAMKNARCKKQLWIKKVKNSKLPAWQLTKVRSKNEVIAEARNEGKTA